MARSTLLVTVGSYKDDDATLLQILGWAARLMQYYKQAGPIGEIPKPTIQSEREAEIQAVLASQQFSEGQELEAGVTAIKGTQVTYESLGTIDVPLKNQNRPISSLRGKL